MDTDKVMDKDMDTDGNGMNMCRNLLYSYWFGVEHVKKGKH